LPLVAAPEHVLVSRYRSAAGTVAFLLESPEPIPLADDVSLALERRVAPPPLPFPPSSIRPQRPQRPQPLPLAPFQPQPIRVLASGDQRAALVIPVDSAGAAIAVAGEVRMQLALVRQRYLSTAADADAIYQDHATLVIG
jgi:hypothetical protein